MSFHCSLPITLDQTYMKSLFKRVESLPVAIFSNQSPTAFKLNLSQSNDAIILYNLFKSTLLNSEIGIFFSTQLINNCNLFQYTDEVVFKTNLLLPVFRLPEKSNKVKFLPSELLFSAPHLILISTVNLSFKFKSFKLYLIYSTQSLSKKIPQFQAG